jgi:hypothetical protein
MPRKMARFAARTPFGLSEVRVAVGTPRLSCREARKAPIYTSVREPSGECRFRPIPTSSPCSSRDVPKRILQVGGSMSFAPKTPDAKAKWLDYNTQTC